MKDQIIQLIFRHLTLMDLVTVSSLRLLCFAEDKDVESTVKEAENRDRLVSLVNELQKKIEEGISQLSPKDADVSFIDILKAWALDLQVWAQDIDIIDQETTTLLEYQKEDTCKEIANIFRIKQQFKGYDLNNLKK